MQADHRPKTYFESEKTFLDKKVNVIWSYCVLIAICSVISLPYLLSHIFGWHLIKSSNDDLLLFYAQVVMPSCWFCCASLLQDAWLQNRCRACSLVSELARSSVVRYESGHLLHPIRSLHLWPQTQGTVAPSPPSLHDPSEAVLPHSGLLPANCKFRP